MYSIVSGDKIISQHVDLKDAIVNKKGDSSLFSLDFVSLKDYLAQLYTVTHITVITLDNTESKPYYIPRLLLDKYKSIVYVSSFTLSDQDILKLQRNKQSNISTLIINTNNEDRYKNMSDNHIHMYADFHLFYLGNYHYHVKKCRASGVLNTVLTCEDY